MARLNTAINKDNNSSPIHNPTSQTPLQDVESESDADDSLAQISFWACPKPPTSLKSSFPPSDQHYTPRSRRAEQRQIWRRARGEDRPRIPRSNDINKSTRATTTSVASETGDSDSDDGESLSVSRSFSTPSDESNDRTPSSPPSNSQRKSTDSSADVHILTSPPEPVESDGPLSPSKLHRIPQMPAQAASHEFWSQLAADAWNDHHSPRKPIFARPIPGNDSSNELETCIKDLTLSSPLKSPRKRDKVWREAKKTFDATKQQMALDFIHELDVEITNGEIALLAQETGGLRLIWSNKLNSTAGRAHWKKEAVKTKHSDGSISQKYKHHASIELAEKVIDDEAKLHNTLAHEFCHLANFMVSGIKNNPHGKEFKAWGAKCSRKFAHLGVVVTTKHSYEIDYKYEWQCIQCQTEYKRHSKSIDTKKHTCGRCKGQLEQTKPAARKPANGKPSDYQVFVKRHFHSLRELHKGESHAYVMKLIGSKYREQQQNQAQAASFEDGETTDYNVSQGFDELTTAMVKTCISGE